MEMASLAFANKKELCTKLFAEAEEGGKSITAHAFNIYSTKFLPSQLRAHRVCCKQNDESMLSEQPKLRTKRTRNQRALAKGVPLEPRRG